MQIYGPNGIGKSSSIKKKRTVSGNGDFDAMLDGLADSAESVSSDISTGSISNLGSLLSLQEIGEEDTPNRKAYKQGKQLLDQLDSLRHELLTGDLTQGQLQQLENSVRQAKERATDPGLSNILEEIELRAAVELAKWQMSKDS